MLWLLGGGIPERSELRLAGAEQALAQGESKIARQELAAAWVYVGSPLYDAAWQGMESERARQRQRWDEVQAGVVAWEALPKVASLEKTSREALELARRSRRPKPELYQSAAALAEECVAAVPAGARVDWKPPGSERSLSDIDAACREIRDLSRHEAQEAQARAQARDAELRSVLRGERLELYERFGDPEPGMEPARDVAKAPVWRFVVGPSGPLRRYENWTFELKGDRVVGKKRTETRE